MLLFSYLQHYLTRFLKKKRTYIYTDAPDYIESLDFDYIETYSFQRGEEYEQNLAHIRKEYEILKRRKEKGKRLTTDEKERLNKLHELLGYTQYLLNKRGQFHPSSKKINVFTNGDPIIDKIKQILRTEIRETPKWLCAPEYRDSMVFYDKSGKIISVLNVCLSCEYMATDMFHQIKGDRKTYYLLKKFFIEIGHEVEDPEHFVLEEMERVKESMNKKNTKRL
ncbi:hypothetical protein QNI16_25255 [Cytophagaceae bacterium YF14B1]|uniref:Uncharacterized protein n=1 Tax=Xanthocytophaga flava TaxID=3048013 RepID=A0AAE3QWK6_9BACT|nr:hypothetical protein [Xanthocytophaga flavus]MDJ1483833.1 hypothetical protein [Xanthocytophaga flavus]